MPANKRQKKQLVPARQYVSNISQRILGFCFAIVCLVIGFQFLFFLPTTFMKQVSPWGWVVTLILLIPTGCVFYTGLLVLMESRKLPPVDLLTRHNTGQLPPEESLVRASAPPSQPEHVLLRAAEQTEQTPPEQLLRAGHPTESQATRT